MLKHLILFLTAYMLVNSANANIEWPVLYATRAVEFTTALVKQCNDDFPAQKNARLSGLEKWKVRNEASAKKIREALLLNMKAKEKDFDLAEFDSEMEKLERSALRQARTPPQAWEEMCVDMPKWLLSEDSDVQKQVNE